MFSNTPFESHTVHSPGERSVLLPPNSQINQQDFPEAVSVVLHLYSVFCGDILDILWDIYFKYIMYSNILYVILFFTTLLTALSGTDGFQLWFALPSFKIYFIEIELICSILLISTIQQSDLVIHKYTHSFS